VVAMIAIVGPAIEIIGSGRAGDEVADVVSPVELAALAGVNGVVLAVGDNLTLAADRGNSSPVAIFIHFHAESASLRNRKSDIRRVYLVHITLAHFAHAKIDGAFSQPHLHGLLVEVQEGKRGHARDVNRSLACLQLSPRIIVRPNFIADRYRTIARSRSPVALTTRLERHAAVDVAQTSDPGWGILLRV